MLPLWWLFLLDAAVAENGRSGWLRYAPLPDAQSYHSSLPDTIIVLNDTKSSPVYKASQELHRGFQGIFGKLLNITYESRDDQSAVVVGIATQFPPDSVYMGSFAAEELRGDGFRLDASGSTVNIVGNNERGALYGAFEYLSRLAQGNVSNVSYTSNPEAPIRWVNEWDNLDGSIERGYAGPSIFFQNGGIVKNLTRVAEYARLLASIGINGIVINNVNANANLLSTQNMQGLGRIADACRPYGVQIGISLLFSSPQSFGGLSTFDPLDSSVIRWWNDITTKLYQRVPDLAGFLIKANSEGQPGPLTYKRTLAEGANLFAKALKPHGGVVMFRAFVYDQLNEANWKADRAKAAVDFFKNLDGKFDDNVVVQIKYGPIDFQVREPVSPLFANLRNTSTAIELQVTQEYLGQQCHLVYLLPLWKTILDFDLRVDGQPSLTRDVVSGKRFGRGLGGYAAVVNVGTDDTWLGSHLALSNLYGYGKLAWNSAQEPEVVLQDWIRLTFGLDPTVADVIMQLSMLSWPAYENYTGNLGIQTLTDITGNHYGPNPSSHDNNGWGQWTRADRDSIGMDRTVSNGTGFSGQYPRNVAAVYENIATTPDDLLLWFHHVSYKQRLKSGKTVIQHFYDAHYSGAEAAQTFPARWESLKDKVDSERFDHVLYRLVYQAGHAIVWRDAISTFYNKLSGIADEGGHVGKHPWRIEAESMTLSGYRSVSVSPAETASNGKAITTSSRGTAQTTLKFPAGKYDIAVGYFDLSGGKATWELLINERSIGKWVGDRESRLGHAASSKLDGHSATRATFRGVDIKPDDVLKVVGTPNGGEQAPVDYVAFLPDGIVD